MVFTLNYVAPPTNRERASIGYKPFSRCLEDVRARGFALMGDLRPPRGTRLCGLEYLS